jgi:hypothetical protein
MGTRIVRQPVNATEFLIRILDQLRDPLAIGLASAAAVLTYAFAQPPPVAVAVGVAVLFVRVAAGLLTHVPEPPRIPPLSLLTEEEIVIATLVGKKLDDEEIAKRRDLTKKRVTKIIDRIKSTLSYQTRKEIEDWAVLWRLVDPPPPPPKPFYEHWLIKTTLTAASFIGLGWTLYSIVNRFWPQVFPR